MLVELLVVVFLALAIDPNTNGLLPVILIMVMWVLTIILVAFPKLIFNRTKTSGENKSKTINVTSKEKISADEDNYVPVSPLIDKPKEKTVAQRKRDKLIDQYQFEEFGQYLSTVVNLVGEKYDNRQDIINTMTTESRISHNFSTFKDKPCIEINFNKKLIGYLPQDFVDLILPIKDYVKSVKIKSIFDYMGDLNVSVYFRVSKDAQELLEELDLYIDTNYDYDEV